MSERGLGKVVVLGAHILDVLRVKPVEDLLDAPPPAG